MAKLNMRKKTGDKLSANEFNAVVEAINDNADKIAKSISDITSIEGKIHPSYYLTEEQYNDLVKQGDIDPNADYNIYEK